MDELRQMGIGDQSARAHAERPASAGVKPAAAHDLSEITQMIFAKEKKEDLSWVTSPWANGTAWGKATSKALNATRPSPVPDLDLKVLMPNSKVKVAARLKAPIHPSG